MIFIVGHIAHYKLPVAVCGLTAGVNVMMTELATMFDQLHAVGLVFRLTVRSVERRYGKESLTRCIVTCLLDALVSTFLYYRY